MKKLLLIVLLGVGMTLAMCTSHTPTDNSTVDTTSVNIDSTNTLDTTNADTTNVDSILDHLDTGTILTDSIVYEK